jgi:NAD(P)H-flavin reductase
MPIDECHVQCEAMGIRNFVDCPLNLDGCCDCPFFSFHVNNIDAGSLYENDDSNPAWVAFPGWFNLGVWSFLLISVLFLVVTYGRMSTTRKLVIKVNRTLSLVGLTMAAMWILVYLIGLNGVGYQPYYAFTSTTVGVFLHIVAGALWSLSGVVQYIGAIRRRWPRIHRANGWVCIVMTFLCSVGLIILILSPHLSNVGATIFSFLMAAYWNLTVILGAVYAVRRDVDSHRRWMTRHMFTGSSIILQRIFNAIQDDIFRTSQYYTGAFYEAACLDASSITSTTITLASRGSDGSDIEFDRVLNGGQMTFACNGIDNLYNAYVFNTEFFLVFLVAGLFAAEAWLWANGLQASQQSVSRCEAAFKLVVGEAAGTAISVRRDVGGEMPITLADKEVIADDTVLLRFRLPNDGEGILVPRLGHVNLRRPGTSRPRPYSPIHALEVGYISFVVRKVSNGTLSPYLVDEMVPGDTLLLSGPMAPTTNAVLDPSAICNAQKILIVAGGTGITPFLSLLETTTARCHVIVREKSKSRSFVDLLARSNLGENVTEELVLDRAALLDRLDAMLLSNGSQEQQQLGGGEEEAEKPATGSGTFDAVLICGPNRFNIAIKKHVRSRKSGIPTFAVGTDDR